MDKIISLDQKAEQRRRHLREKAKRGIDSREIADYYQRVIKYSVRHLSFLQRFMVEEFLCDVVYELFYYGVECSRRCLSGLDDEEMIRRCAPEVEKKVKGLYGRHQIYQYVGEWDAQSVMMIADDLGARWFEKGVKYGVKQRKLRLL